MPCARPSALQPKNWAYPRLAVVEAAGLTLVGPSSLKAALDLDWGNPVRVPARWAWSWRREHGGQHWLEQQPTLAAQEPPLKEGMETITQMITQDTEPDPEGGPGGRRIKKHVAPARRISLEDTDMRHGRKSSAKTFNGFKEHFAVDLDSKVIREVVVRPANEPEHEAVELPANTLEKAQACCNSISTWGVHGQPPDYSMGGAGVYIIARPWPQVGLLFTKNDFTLDFAGMQVTCPGGQTVPMVPGKHGQFPAAASVTHVPCAPSVPKPRAGKAEAPSIREDEPFQQKLRAKMKIQRGRASLRKQTAVEHTIAHQLAHQGRRARYKACAKTSLMAGAMRRSVTSRSQYIMRRSIALPPEILPT